MLRADPRPVGGLRRGSAGLVGDGLPGVGELLGGGATGDLGPGRGGLGRDGGGRPAGVGLAAAIRRPSRLIFPSGCRGWCEIRAMRRVPRRIQSTSLDAVANELH